MQASGGAAVGVRAVGADYYLFDDENLQYGVMRKDNAWVSYKEKDYFPNAQGVLYRNRTISFGLENIYYLDNQGAKVTDTVITYNDKIYLLNEEGKSIIPKVGWIDKGGKHYFANEKGEFYQNRWITFGPEVSHYMGADGAAYTGVRAVGSNLHLFDDSNNQRGKLRIDNAWVSYNGKEYFPNAQGNLYHDRFISFGTTYYYMDSKGIKATTPSKVMGYELTPDSNTGAISQFAYNEYLDYSNGPTKAAKEILDRIGWNLKAAFEYSKKMTYYGNEMRLPSTRDYANFGFANNKGNCYVKAATFYYFAKLMNFDVTQVSGYISNLSTPHSWTVIDHGGVKYVYDPIDGIDSFRTYKISYGQSGTLKYLNGLYMEKV